MTLRGKLLLFKLLLSRFFLWKFRALRSYSLDVSDVNHECLCLFLSIGYVDVRVRYISGCIMN